MPFFKINAQGIKCDGQFCYFKIEDIPFECMSMYVNMKCPLCGENLLTEVDWKTIEKLKTIQNFCDRIGLNWLYDKLSRGKTTYKIKMDGNGTIGIKDT